MKTVILYSSTHHGNTKKLLSAIAEQFPVELVDVEKAQGVDLSAYDRIGFAGGVAFGKLYPCICDAVATLPPDKEAFFLYTCGRNSRDFSAPLQAIAQERGCRVLGSYGCRGFDTFGPFKLIGGINKHCPDAAGVQGAVDFYAAL